MVPLKCINIVYKLLIVNILFQDFCCDEGTDGDCDDDATALSALCIPSAWETLC